MLNAGISNYYKRARLMIFPLEYRFMHYAWAKKNVISYMFTSFAENAIDKTR